MADAAPPLLDSSRMATDDVVNWLEAVVPQGVSDAAAASAMGGGALIAPDADADVDAAERLMISKHAVHQITEETGEYIVTNQRPFDLEVRLVDPQGNRIIDHQPMELRASIVYESGAPVQFRDDAQARPDPHPASAWSARPDEARQ